MCIRDSFWAVFAALLVCLVVAGAFLGALIAVNLSRMVATSVSYTHLRAHETVLDIVCRLLLETKHDTLPTALFCSLVYN